MSSEKSSPRSSPTPHAHFVTETVVEVEKDISPEIIEEEVIEYVEKIVEYPVKVTKEKIIEKEVIVEEERIVRVPRIVKRRKEVTIPKIQYVDKIIEQEVPGPIEYDIQEKVVEIPITKYVDVPYDVIEKVPEYVEVPRYIPVPVEVVCDYHFKAPKIKTKYVDLDYTVTVPRFIEVPNVSFKNIV
eukprot:GHVP01020758.1.p1 GENE.GHVP01020758.1~~GHVP01020758.1.p1  ORF type:complete len:186 (+),score=28.23 GHVP01020758.1:623-1180(+)